MGAAGVIAFILERWLLPSSGAVLVILAGVIITALNVAHRIAYSAVLFGAAIFNFFFTEPRGSLHMQDIEEITTMAVFVAVGFAMVYWIMRERAQRVELNDAELRSTILLSLSHDLRSPLTSIIGNLSTLQIYRDKISADEHDELLNGAMSESQRLHHYLENLFQVTRFEHAPVHITPKPTYIQAVIEQTLSRFTSADNNANHIMVEWQAPLDTSAELHASLFEQALYNIFDNALRYRLPNSHVHCRIQRHNDHTVICIENQLQRPLEDDPQQWLKPFYSSRLGDRGVGGAGLGLSVARSIILAHQGRITLHSQNQQLQVVIELP